MEIIKSLATITVEDAYTLWFNDVDIQAKRIANICGNPVEDAEWFVPDMNAFSKEELKQNHFVFRKTPKMINGWEIEPPLTYQEIQKAKQLGLDLYTLTVNHVDYRWTNVVSRNTAETAIKQALL